MTRRIDYPLAALLMAGSAVPASASLTSPQLVTSACAALPKWYWIFFRMRKKAHLQRKTARKSLMKQVID